MAKRKETEYIKCLAALERYEHLSATLGADHPQTKAAMLLAIDLAPPELQDMAHSVAAMLGVLPPASGYLEDGQAVFRVEDAAARRGQSPAEFMAERADAGLDIELIDPALIHRTQ